VDNFATLVVAFLVAKRQDHIVTKQYR